MSFEVYLQYFYHGQPAGIARAQLAGAFTGWAIEEDGPNIWNLQSGRVQCRLQLDNLPAEDLVHSITMMRPPSAAAFWNCLFSLLGETAILYYPGGQPAITSPAALVHVPTDMLEAVGNPAIVSGPNALQLLVTAA